MYLTDSHAHSRVSPDGFVPMTEMARAALAAGMAALTLTDHCDLLATDGSARTLQYDWTPVLAEREAMLARYGTRLDLPLGVELGMAQIDPPAARRILAQPGLDFVIGSIHNRSEAAGGGEFYYGTYHDPALCHATLDDYFTSMEALAPLDVYDVLGHINYPLRYMERDGQTMSLAPYHARIRAILRTVAEHGRGIELNTFRGKGVAPWRALLALYKEVGGEIITVGSDAHRPESVGGGVAEAYALLEDLGFRYVAVYHDRTPEFYKL